MLKMAVSLQFVSGKVVSIPSVRFGELSQRVLSLHYLENNETLSSMRLFDRVSLFDKDYNKLEYDNDKVVEEGDYYIFIQTADDYM